MILSLIAGYLTCIMLAFLVMKRKVSPGLIAIGALIGVVMLIVTVAWKQAAPTTGQMNPGSWLQVAEQPSPELVLPSSHCSSPVRLRSPH